MVGNGHMAWQQTGKKSNAIDDGSRSLAFCSRVNTKATISSEALKTQRKKKRRKKDKSNIIQDSFQTESSPTHSFITTEENVPCISNDSCKGKSLITHKPKVWSVYAIVMSS